MNLISVNYLILNNMLILQKQKYAFSQRLKEDYPFIVQISGSDDKLRCSISRSKSEWRLEERSIRNKNIYLNQV